MRDVWSEKGSTCKEGRFQLGGMKRHIRREEGKEKRFNISVGRLEMKNKNKF